MNTNIPLYRAKKIGNDERVIGYLVSSVRARDIFIREHDDTLGVKGYAIHASTLSIHFADMLAIDSDRLLPSGEKDLRIFASLSEDGKGGDIISESKSVGVVILEKGRSMINWIKDKDFFSRDLCNHHKRSKITGIKQ